MTDKQPEALRLAECLDEPDYCTILQMRQAAAELRRLHEVNAELVKVVTYFRYMLTDPTLVGVAVRALAKAQGDNND